MCGSKRPVAGSARYLLYDIAIANFKISLRQYPFTLEMRDCGRIEVT